MKEDILEYFKSDRSFEAGKALYLKCPNRNKRTVAELNTRNNSAKNLEYVHYHLFLLTGLKDRVRVAIMQQPIAKKVLVISLPTNLEGGNSTGDSNPPEGESTEGNTEPTKEKILEALAADTKAKQGIKLREQFPFLSGDNVPDVYKILVADLITARESFVAAHPKLHELVPEEELLQQTKDVLEPYKENKLIWAELEHYQKEGEPLGKHPKFEELELDKQLEAMDKNERSHKKGLVENYLLKAEKDLKKAKEANDEKKIEAAKNRITKHTLTLAKLTALLKTS